MKNKMMSKAISVLLALMMVFCLMPMSALADTHVANTLNYDANGGEGAPVSGSSDTSAIVIDSTVPTRTGYDFIGWNTSAAGDGVTYSAGNTYTFAEDTGAGGCTATLYAKWQIKEYNVIFMVDGKVHSTVDVKHGENVELPEIPEKSGYDETAPTWDKDGKNITEDTVITAVYTVNGYEVVLGIYNTYTAMKTALEGTSVEELKAATEEFITMCEETLENAEEMTEEQGEELLKLLGMSEEDFFIDVLTTSVNAAVIVGLSDIYDAYIENPTVKTAYEFVTLYNELFEELESDYESDEESDYELDYDLEEIKTLVYRFFPDIDDVYTQALNNLPAEDVMNAYEAYSELEFYIEFFYVEELKSILEEYQAVFENIENMPDEQKNELSELMEITADEVIDTIAATVKQAKTLIAISDAYDAFTESSNAQTASALVEQYEAASKDEDFMNLLREYFYDIDEVYAEALKLIPEPEDKPADTGKGDDKGDDVKADISSQENSNVSKTDNSKDESETKANEKDDSNTSPKTGDNGDGLWVILAIFSSAILAALALYNKRTKETK